MYLLDMEIVFQTSLRGYIGRALNIHANKLRGMYFMFRGMEPNNIFCIFVYISSAIIKISRKA